MDLFETIMVAMLAGMSNSIIHAIWAILEFIFVHAVNVSIINDDVQISALNKILSTRGICAVKNFDYSELPAAGTHFLITWKGKIPSGILMATKSYSDHSSRYKVHWIGSGIKSLRVEIVGDPNLIQERRINPVRYAGRYITLRIMPPGEANRWQSTIIDQILSDYGDKKISSTIISGPPGCGKTTLGVLVARMIKSIGVEPELVGNMDFQIPDMDLSSAYGHPSAARPTILMLNEFDGAIKFAERSREGQNGASKNCLADTPSSLLNAIDFMSKTRYLIIIATSNLKIKELTSGIYERYFRQGRFNNHYEVRGSKAVKSAPPGLYQNNSAARHK